LSKQSKHRYIDPEKLVERDIVFTFGPTTPQLQEALDTLHGNLKQRIYSTRSQLIISEDKTQAKIKLWCNTMQVYNLDGFLRNVEGVKYLSEDDPIEMLSRLIQAYHRDLWHKLSFPSEEMHLSAFAAGIAGRLAILDYPDLREQKELWVRGRECYKAMEETNVFGDLLPYQDMIIYSFIGGYLSVQGTCETSPMAENVKMKSQVIVLEDEGRPQIIIHAYAERIRDQLMAKGYRHVMELMKQIQRER
jgi:hypothetical protein